MLVKIKEVGKGLHPSEAVVQISTEEGSELLIVDRRSIADETIDVGYPIANRNDYLLIELPRETVTGSWRVWINKEIVTEEILEGGP